MNSKMTLIAVSVQAVLCLGACQSVPTGDQALKVSPAEQVRHGTNRPEALYAIGRYHQGQMRYDKAIDTYTRLLTEYPDHAEAHNALGIIYANQGRHDAAIGELVKAVEGAPDSASVLNNLGYAYMLQGSVGKAIEAFAAAGQLDPANQRVRDNLDTALAQSGEGSHVAQSSPPATKSHSETERKITAPAAGMQLITVSTNVYTLQRPDKDPVKTTAPVITPLPQGVGQIPLEAPAATVATVAPTPKNGMRLEVSNGNGVTGLARKTSTHLTGAGYGKIRMTNEMPYRLAATEIQYRPGFEPQARDLQTTLHPGIPLVASKQLRADIQVRLLLGKDMKSVDVLVAQTLPEQLRVAIR